MKKGRNSRASAGCVLSSSRAKLNTGTQSSVQTGLVHTHVQTESLVQVWAQAREILSSSKPAGVCFFFLGVCRIPVGMTVSPSSFPIKKAMRSRPVHRQDMDGFLKVRVLDTPQSERGSFIDGGPEATRCPTRCAMHGWRVGVLFP